jgi:hypothetical protein
MSAPDRLLATLAFAEGLFVALLRWAIKATI